MDNHVHLLATPDLCGGLSRMMQAVNRTYVRRVNDRQGRIGTLWEGRFHSTVVDTDRYLLACQRYIELNPVRAGKVAHPVTIAGRAIVPMRVAGPMRCSSRIRHLS